MIGIIGHGVVGKAASNTLKKSFNLVIYDKYLDLDKFSDLSSCDMVFIMVPTPFDVEQNEVDLSAVEDALERLKLIDYLGTVILKSTIPPGTTKRYKGLYNFDLVFNPEFLRESTTPNEDFANQDVVVIGADSDTLFEKCKNMYSKVLKKNTEYFFVDTTTAEMIKSSQNTMLASRVAIANLIFDACSQIDVEYDIVKKIAFDRFEIIGPHMTQVPGPDGNRGFGGKCLPKDIRALSSVSSSKLLRDIILYNDTLRDDLNKVLKNYNKDGK